MEVGYEVWSILARKIEILPPRYQQKVLGKSRMNTYALETEQAGSTKFLLQRIQDEETFCRIASNLLRLDFI